MLVFHTSRSHLVLSGNTFPVKDILKSIGAKWDGPSKTWLANLAQDGAIFRISLQNCEILAGKGPDALEGGHNLSFWTDRAKTFAKLSVLAKKQQGILDTDYWWLCCERCTVHDWNRQRATCPCHR